MPAEYLEGRHALTEAIAANVPIEEVLVSAAAHSDKRVAEQLRRIAKEGVKVRQVGNAELDKLSSHGAHQGVVARVKPYRYATLGDLIAKSAGQNDALIIVCDHITDNGNFGAICRSAESVGAVGVLIPNKRSASVNAAAYKTSAGAVVHLPIAMEANIARSLEKLKEEGYWVVGASEHATQLLWDAPLSGRIALVMGSEDKGISDLVLKKCDLTVALPQNGVIESLNVAQATTAMAYEWMRQCRDARS